MSVHRTTTDHHHKLQPHRSHDNAQAEAVPEISYKEEIATVSRTRDTDLDEASGTSYANENHLTGS